MSSIPAGAGDAERRSVVRLQAGLIFLLVLLLIASYELFEHRTSKGISSSPPVALTGVSEDRALPAAVLTGSSGRQLALSSLGGKVVVLAPFATLCGTSCAATTSAFAQLEAELRTAGYAGQVALVQLSVDPTHDSTARLASFARATGASWDVMSGSASQVGSLWRALGQFYQVGRPSPSLPRDGLTGAQAGWGVSYADAVYFLGTDGRLRIADFAAPQVAADPAAARLLAAEGVAPAGAPSSGWTVSQAFGNIELLFNRRIPLH